MNIGFTGTKQGMTFEQVMSIFSLIERWADESCGFEKFTARHGDCKGSDAQFHRIMNEIFHAYIVVYPPKNDKYRAFCIGHEMKEPKEYLERDKDIVKDCGFLIATPKEYNEVLLSGTWSTVRYARRMKKDVYLIYPSGVIKREINT